MLIINSEVFVGIKKILTEVTAYKPKKIIPIIILTIVNNLLRGIGIIIIIPVVAFFINHNNDNYIWQIIQLVFTWLGLEPSIGTLLVFMSIFIVIVALLERMITLRISLYKLGLKHHFKKKIFRQITNMPWSSFVKFHSNELIRILSVELNLFTATVNQMFNLVNNLIRTVSYLLVALYLNWLMTISMVFIMFFVLLVSVFMNRKILMYSKRTELARSQVSQVIMSSMSNFKYSKAQGLEKTTQELFETKTKNEFDSILKTQKIRLNTQTFIGIASIIGLSFFTWLAVVVFEMQFEIMAVLLLIGVKSLQLVSNLQKSWQLIISGIPSFNNISKIVGVKQNNLFVPCVINLFNHVEFRDVKFNHLNTELSTLLGVDFKIIANKITTLIGVSGSGKTTIVDLVVGLLTPDSGKILVDGVELDCRNLNSWRSNIAYLPQDPVLLSGTIKDNFTMHNSNISDIAIWDSLRLASADNLVENLPDKLNTLIEQNDSKILSGGEKQRIALARAISHKPQLLVLDEPTSSQDYLNESSIQLALQELKATTTILVIGHSRSVIHNSDYIVLLENGKIKCVGDSSDIHESPVFKNFIE